MTLRRLNHSFYLNNMRDIFSGQRKRDLQAGLSSNDNSTEMKMLLIVDSSVYLPDDNPRKRAMISLKLLCFLRNVTESQNSLLYVTLWIWANETMKDISDSSGRQNAMMVIVSTFSTERDSLAREIEFLSDLRILPRSGAPLQMMIQVILSDIWA
ncbi:uncharacterized protein LOC102915568 isoform X2 [Peromyscus maniculatus bairdii]|uniref:uncharacterized protein LOC102915568 isoform X2 n=1 Tax=Peromyscus maniculatus bairdii TaxID=230844 RepID=UPI003FD68623